MIFIILLILHIVPLFNAQKSVESAFKSAGIVTDVIDRAPPSNGFMEVNYLNGTADLGNELSPTQVRNEPTVSWPVMSNTSAALYTIIMTDPDAPSRSNRSLADVKHWIVGNILGNDVLTGQTIAEYIGAAPPSGSGHHRYVFLVYEQAVRIDYSMEPRSSNRTLDYRFQFSARNFARQYDLGDPVAGNFFLAQYDATVDELQREWGA